eukprot:3916473-Rhodomonas_salina.1
MADSVTYKVDNAAYKAGAFMAVSATYTAVRAKCEAQGSGSKVEGWRDTGEASSDKRRRSLANLHRPLFLARLSIFLYRNCPSDLGSKQAYSLRFVATNSLRLTANNSSVLVVPR